MLSLKNEFLMPPVKLGYSRGDGKITQKHFDFYGQRRKYLGAIALEPLYMDSGLREVPTQLGIDGDDKIKGLSSLVSMIQETDTRVIAHLNHPGRMANPKIPKNYFVSSSSKACEAGGPEPKRLETDEIKGIVNLFASSAVRAEKAGFDSIELQFGHGYLMAQFMSPKVNDRTDEYGGSFENRVRFPLEVLDAVKQAVRVPIIVRMSADEMIPDGIKLPEMILFAKLLEGKGAGALHVSAGTLCSTPPWFFQHMFVPKGKTWELAGMIKKEVNIPVIFVGKVNSKEDIDRLKEEYKADYIAAGRALVADPDFIGKYTGKVPGAVRPCMECVQGCLGGVKSGKGLGCLINPSVGKELPKTKECREKKTYAVAGGGPAGMEAALNLAAKGCQVDLFEKGMLGGQFLMASRTQHKKPMERLISFYKSELERNGVNIIFKKAVKQDLADKYDAVILATGAVPSIPPIEGLTDFRGADILMDEKLPQNKNILIIGGGLTGVDVATALLPGKNTITIVKRSTDFGQNMEMISKKLSLKELAEHGVVFSDYTHISKVDGRTVYAKRKDEDIVFSNIDLIIVSAGMKSNNPLEAELDAKVPVYVIGDAKNVGDAQDAIEEGYLTAASL